jgi:hypothetical protein
LAPVVGLSFSSYDLDTDLVVENLANPINFKLPVDWQDIQRQDPKKKSKFPRY